MRRTAAARRGLYAALGLPKGAPIDDIRNAYLRKAQLLHPDRNPRPSAAREFRELAHAFESLTNPRLRKFYDVMGKLPVDDDELADFNEAVEIQKGYAGAGGYAGGSPGEPPQWPGARREDPFWRTEERDPHCFMCHKQLPPKTMECPCPCGNTPCPFQTDWGEWVKKNPVAGESF